MAASIGVVGCLVYVGTALAKIAGCFSFGAWFRLGKYALWLAPGYWRSPPSPIS